jgi:hypothetical protein
VNFDKCIICEAPITTVHFRTGVREFECKVCGKYLADEELASDGLDKEAVPAAMRHLLQAWIKRRPIEGLKPPRLTDKACADAIGEIPQYSPAEKMEQLLLAYGALCNLPSGTCNQDPRLDYPYAFARDERECQEYCAWLGMTQLGFIQGAGSGITVTRAGWERVSELRKKQPASGRTAFVAMWFDDAMDDAWASGLRPGVVNAGFEPRRLKEEVHPDRIDTRIVAAIRSCRFLVADVTGARPAVYYEAGLAEGLNKTVVWTCRRDKEREMCFDTRQFRHILWDKPEDLSSQLTDTIRALIP